MPITFGDFFIPTDSLGLSWITDFWHKDFSESVFENFVIKINYHDIPGFNCYSDSAEELIEGICTIIFVQTGVIQRLTPNFYTKNNIDLELVVEKMRNGCDINTFSVKKIQQGAIIAGLQEIVRQLLSF